MPLSCVQRCGSEWGWCIIWVMGPRANPANIGFILIIILCSQSQPADMAAMCEGCTDIPAPTSILSFVIISSLFFTCFLSLARRFWNHIFTYKTTSYTWNLEENCCSVPVSQINSVPAPVQPFFWWWCICCSETPSPAPVSGGHCTLLGTYPWFWSDL